MSRAVLLILAIMLCPPLAAQQSTPQATGVSRGPVPQVATTAEGEASVTPDRATIMIGVQTRASTAAEASAENARKQRAVIDTLRALGVAANQIRTVNFSVYPEQRYHPNEGDSTPRIVGYNVVNTVQVHVQHLDRIGPLIDAALASGANGINSLELTASNTDDARRTALAAALSRARGDAEALARAAGGRLGGLIDVNTGGMAVPRPVMRMQMSGMAEAARAPTPISPGEETMHVTVTARWHFVGGANP
ncbi:MAG TPA: SIMPL domain-containing protein [Gemmatimonadaceae bacterium]|nr:SIMPL domain-containing protein [Gemmatimonadaceae bacterium]